MLLQGRGKALAAKGTSRANPGALGRSALLTALLQLCLFSSQWARDALDQVWMFKHCHEGSPCITAGRQKIKQRNPQSKPTEARRQPWTERPQESHEQADKTALVQANVPGKVWFDNKNQRYLYLEQRLCTPVGQPERRNAEVGSRARTPAAQSTVLQPTADEGRQGSSAPRQRGYTSTLISSAFTFAD